MTASAGNFGERRIRVLVVDDSALMRRLLTRLLQSDPAIEVVGSAQDAYVARAKIKELNPDVLTLDIEMPKMDGLTFLSNLMRLRPMPVIMVSSLTERGAEVTLRALDLGALDFISKPTVDLEAGMASCTTDLIAKVKMASTVKVSALARPAGISVASCTPPASRSSRPSSGNSDNSEQLIAMGSSTGGTEAVKEVLANLRADSPAVVITQHIPPLFSKSFAERMDRCSPLQVCEAADGQYILPGHAYIAPGDKHLTVVKDAGRFRCVLKDGAEVSGHRPSVDVLFDSVVRSAGHNAIGVILTGMGRDGADALKRLRETGAKTIAQDEASCVVYGMPKAAVEIGAAKDILGLADIAPKLEELTRTQQ